MRLTTCKKCKKTFRVDPPEKSNWIENKSKCPYCKVTYCNKPPTEKKLMDLQDQYFLHSRSEKYFNEIIKILYDYTQSLILKYYSFAVHSATDTLEYYIWNTVSFIVEEFQSKEDYRVYGSWAGVILGKIKQSLYSKNEKLQDDLSINWIFEDNNEVDYANSGDEIIDLIEQKENNINLCNYLAEFIFKIEEYCEDSAEDYIRLLALSTALSKGERAADLFFKEDEYKRGENFEIIQDAKGNKIISSYASFGKMGKEMYLKTLASLREEILSIKENSY